MFRCHRLYNHEEMIVGFSMANERVRVRRKKEFHTNEISPSIRKQNTPVFSPLLLLLFRVVRDNVIRSSPLCCFYFVQEKKERTKMFKKYCSSH